MATEERLRDELNRAVDSVHPDAPTALIRVVAKARRRQRARHVALAMTAVVVVAVGALGISHVDLANLGQSPPPSDAPQRPHHLSEPSDIHAGARTVLTGEWQTDAVQARQVRGVLTRAGISSTLADDTLGAARQWLVQMTFSQHEGTAALVVQTSDPTDPGVSLTTSDQYLYRLLPGNRLLVTPSHPDTRWVFSYRLVNDSLRLHLLHAAPGPLAGRTTAQLAAWTFAPLRLVH